MLNQLKEWASSLDKKLEPVKTWIRDHKRLCVYLASAHAYYAGSLGRYGDVSFW